MSSCTSSSPDEPPVILRSRPSSFSRDSFASNRDSTESSYRTAESEIEQPERKRSVLARASVFIELEREQQQQRAIPVVRKPSFTRPEQPIEPTADDKPVVKEEKGTLSLLRFLLFPLC